MKYRIKEKTSSKKDKHIVANTIYCVQVNILCFWITIKIYPRKTWAETLLEELEYQITQK